LGFKKFDIFEIKGELNLLKEKFLYRMGLIDDGTPYGKINEYTYQKGIFNDFKEFIN
jgi:hypothetical protein